MTNFAPRLVPCYARAGHIGAIWMLTLVRPTLWLNIIQQYETVCRTHNTKSEVTINLEISLVHVPVKYLLKIVHWNYIMDL